MALPMGSCSDQILILNGNSGALPPALLAFSCGELVPATPSRNVLGSRPGSGASACRIVPTPTGFRSIPFRDVTTRRLLPSAHQTRPLPDEFPTYVLFRYVPPTGDEHQSGADTVAV